MKLFCFASRNEENIQRGYAASKWAVSTTSQSVMRSRATKARRYFTPGSRGLLYCGSRHYFTMPFVSTSEADPTAVVKDIWPEPWVLPFSIEPLGDPDKRISASTAAQIWSIFNRYPVRQGGVTAALNITGVTVFSPVEVTQDEWSEILRDLGR